MAGIHGDPPPQFIVEPFRPPFWARGPQSQTILSSLLRNSVQVPTSRERINTPDGDFLDLDFVPPESKDPQTPLLIGLHGLEGSSESSYIKETLRLAVAVGYRAVGVNYRGCSGEPNLTTRMYHSGFTQDLEFLLDLFSQRWPEAPFVAVGFSLGANLLLKYCGQQPVQAASQLTAIAAVSPPFDLKIENPKMERGFNRRYTQSFLKSLWEKLVPLQSRFESQVDFEAIRQATTLREFDDAFVAPIYGFRDADDYYDQSSSGRYLPDIRIPTLILRAIDDPFFDPKGIPYATFAANPWISASTPERGGHVGFMEKRGRYWAERQAVRFFETCLMGSDKN